MLGFIKRYQKFFFIVTAFFVCISVVFFGLMPKNLSKVKDDLVFKTHTGRKIKRSQLDGIKALLLTCNGELLLYGQHLGMQFFAQDPFTEYLVKTGFLKLIADKQEKELLEDFHKQHEYEKHFKPYSHPGAAFLSAEDIWAAHAPELRAQLKKLQKEVNPKKAFEIKTELFLEENNFSPFALWQFLSERQSSYSWLQPDENLRPQSLALFGYRTLQDWFGEKLINYACQFIYEISSEAKKNGYQVTLKEAEMDLMKLNDHYFEQMQFLGLKEFPDSESYFQMKLQRLGMNKMQMISLWREILTFQQFFNEASLAPLLDELTLKEFETYASDQLEVARYTPPQDLRFNSIQELASFEAYLRAIGKNKGDTALDFARLSTEEIAKTTPQFVEQEVEVSYKEVDLNESALKIKVQDVWKWKSDPKNANALIAKFPKLKLNEKLSLEEYSKTFDTLDYFTNMQIDQYVRQTLLKENPEWLKQAFDNQNLKVETLKVRKNGQNLPFKGLEISSKKEKFLEAFFANAQLKEKQKEMTYCFDDLHHYQIMSVQSKKEPSLVSYEKLKADKSTQKLLNRYLAKEHKSSSYKDQELDKVKDKVLELWLAPLKKQILEDYVAIKGEKPKYLPDSFYCKNRLIKPMHDALLYYQQNQEEKPEVYAFNSLWKIESRRDVLVRHTSDEVEKWLSLNVGEWSHVSTLKEAPEFILLLKKNNMLEQHPMQKQIKNELKREMTLSLAKEELENIDFKN